MADLLIRNIEPELKRQIEERAQARRRSLSDEAKRLIRKGLLEPKVAPGGDRKLGTAMLELVQPEDRGDDLIFELPGEIRNPPDFE
jgi:plasmid stability protein